jgi:DNA-directed RNA polymerase subunit RPC12/RpoP
MDLSISEIGLAMTGRTKAMTRKDSNKTGSNRLLYWVNGYIYLTATALALVGLFLLSTWWATRNSDDWWLGWRDPLLGISSRAMLVVGGLLHLAVAAYLFAARDVLNRTLAVLWVGLNHLIYYAGVHSVEPSALPNTERFIGWRLRLQPVVVDSQWNIFQLSLIVTSVVFLVLIWHSPWRHSKQLKKEAWFKQWQENRKQYEKTAPSKKPQPADDYTKNVCSHCGQKITFPLSRVGESIACPHCAARITLRESPARMV